MGCTKGSFNRSGEIATLKARLNYCTVAKTGDSYRLHSLSLKSKMLLPYKIYSKCNRTRQQLFPKTVLELPELWTRLQIPSARLLGGV